MGKGEGEDQGTGPGVCIAATGFAAAGACAALPLPPALPAIAASTTLRFGGVCNASCTTGCSGALAACSSAIKTEALAGTVKQS